MGGHLLSDKMTVIRLPGLRNGHGFMDYGEVPPQEIIQRLRNIHQEQLEAAQKVLAAKDEDFEIEVVRGKFVEHHIKWLQNPLGLVRKKTVK